MAPPPPPCWPKRFVWERLRNVAAGANPIALKRGIEQAVAAVTEALARQAQGVETGSRSQRPHHSTRATSRLHNGRRGNGDGPR